MVNMLNENEETSPDSNPIQSEEEEVTDSELDVSDSSPSQGDPTKYCPVCDWESKKGTSRSMKSHIRHYAEVEGDEEHITGKDEAYALIDDWRESQRAAGKPARKPTTRRAPSGSAAVKIKGVSAEFTPAESDRIVELEREIQILRKEEQRDQFWRRSPRHDREERDRDRHDDENNQMWGMMRELIRSNKSDGGSSSEVKEMRNIIFSMQSESVKAAQDENRELNKEIRAMRDDMRDLRDEVRNVQSSDGNFAKEVAREIIGIKKRQYEREPEIIVMNPDADKGILERLNSDIIVDE